MCISPSPPPSGAPVSYTHLDVYKRQLVHGPGRLGSAAVVSLYLVFVSGSVVVNAGAQSACKSWPACLSSPAAMGLVTIQIVHRSIVLIGSVIVVAFLLSLLRSGVADAVERKFAIGALALLVTQIVVGALSAIETSHTEFADVHLAFAAALWCAVVATFALSARGRQLKHQRFDEQKIVLVNPHCD